jgi:hypothetical protein
MGKITGEDVIKVTFFNNYPQSCQPLKTADQALYTETAYTVLLR